jgi:hypothetical protein
MKNLDEIINEVNYSFMNKYISSAKANSGKPKDFNAFEYEKTRQNELMNKIDKAKEKVEELKKKGEAKETISKQIEKINKLEAELENGFKANASKSKELEDTHFYKIIAILKGKICFLMMDYVNLVSGVGLNGDVEAKNAVKIVKTKKDEEGYQETKVVGAPSEATITNYYNKLKKAIEQLKKYEDSPEIKHKYHDDHLARANELLKILDDIKPSEISFDLDSYGTPVHSDAQATKTGARTGRKNVNGTDEKYSEFNKVTIKNGKVLTTYGDMKGVKKIGAARFNPFVYEELQPYIHEFQKYRKDWNLVKQRFEGKKFFDSVDDPAKLFKVVKDGLKTDFVDNSELTSIEKRIEGFSKAFDKKGKEGKQEYKKLKKTEKGFSEMNKKIKDAREEGDNGTVRNLNAYKHKNLINYVYGNKDSSSQTSGNDGWLNAHHIPKINITKVRKMINKWIEEGKEPSTKNGNLIKFYGVVPGTSGMGGGTLVFIPLKFPEEQGQFKYEGLYCFRASKSFYNQFLAKEQKFIENHAGKTKNDAWKNGVQAALKKFDTEEIRTSVQTEEISYFNY